MTPADDSDGAPDSGQRSPDRSKDDTDLGWGDASAAEERRDAHEQWLLEQRPPHWD